MNEVRFTVPYDVIWEPDLQPAKDVEASTYTVAVAKPGGGDGKIKPDISSSFSELFEKSWANRIVEVETKEISSSLKKGVV